MSGPRATDTTTSAQQTLDSKLLHLTSGPRDLMCLHLPIPIVLYDISQLLNTGLDRETLVTCVGMIESGVNPEALAVSDEISCCDVSR